MTIMKINNHNLFNINIFPISGGMKPVIELQPKFLKYNKWDWHFLWKCEIIVIKFKYISSTFKFPISGGIFPDILRLL